MSAFSNVIAGAKSAMRSGVQNSIPTAINQLVQGNVADARTALLQAPADALNAYGAAGNAGLGDSFAGLQARGDALQNWCWYCICPTIGNVNAIGIDTSIGKFGATVALPWYYIQSANAPLRQIQTDSIQRNGHAVHYPTSYSVDQLTLGLAMDTENKAMQWYRAWQSLILESGNPEVVGKQGLWGLPAEYKKTIQIVMYSPSKQLMLNIKYINCFPASTTPLDLVSDSSGALVLNATFLVEDVYFTVSNTKGILDNIFDTVQGYALGAIQTVAQPYLNKLDDFVANIFQ